MLRAFGCIVSDPMGRSERNLKPHRSGYIGML